MSIIKSKKFWLQLVIVAVFCLAFATVTSAAKLNPQDATAFQTWTKDSADRGATAVREVFGWIAAIFLIIGAFQFLTAAGDSSKIQAAKDKFKYTLGALALVIMADKIVGLFYGIFGGNPT
ncbi:MULTISPECIES: hypothetical protein [Paenibacillus]|uniref:TrbC/VIRB2 family protein n=2 Tax=Paenibacillus TaxID=44249 RepID=A0ABX2MLA1_9BACL|nr:MULTISPECIES: hypothetical protein [Paenibacillus]NUU54818.1 hypothetical protein [Paenibacillus taichungensis]SEB27592.1 hypothetical protein SAMN03159332_6257 [Paenibacillus sp. 276b]SLK16329.1 hypothetical protein SAMN06272722_110136 [Paenibacillus sp. RU5A]SOC74328.1 hypothetical protein SAMN05880581_110136 [Paenibacillus sp. RU26A]SOC76459.1 hypothetical protein SAMN05880586_110136 [Paenibacillus sp. RU5M]